jgi:general secretion pathway protein A
MYNEYFGLEELPFSIAPDPRYLYLSEQHREALAHLIYGINTDGGVVLLTGEVGTGKTTVCRCLIEQLPENTEIAFVLNPKLTVEELLASICDEFRITYPKGNTSIKVFVDLINSYLLDAHSRGRNTVLIIDEAQNLSANVLEQLRLLTNLETSRHKLLQIILIGQPELQNILSKPELRQLAQRITARYHLGPLAKKDISPYITHRLSVAGLRSRIFPPSTITRLFRLSGGIPRLINMVCDRAMLGAFVKGQSKVKKSTLKKAAREVFGDQAHKDRRTGKSLFLLVSLSLILMGVIFIPGYHHNNDSDSVAVRTTGPAKTYNLLEPSNNPEHSGKPAAYKALFRQWDITYLPEGNGPACSYAFTQGLRCMHKLGSLGSLIRTNRPAVLELFDSRGNEFYAALTALTGETATFVLGPETRTVPLKDLETQWLGNYTVLWRTPPGYKGYIRQGHEGTIVEWVEKQLALVQGLSYQEKENSVFDDALVKQVREFQHTEGLVPDGVVGAQTIIKLNTINTHGIPVLIRKEKNL